MPRIEGRRHGRAQIDIAHSQHDVAGIEDEALHIIYGTQPIDAANALDMARAPRCVLTAPSCLSQLATQGGIEPVPQTVAEEIGGHYDQGDGHSWEQDRPPGLT